MLAEKQTKQITGFHIWWIYTFERYNLFIDEILVVEVGQEAAGARGPEDSLRDAVLLGGIESEAHDAVGDNTGHRRDLRRGVVEPIDEVKERTEALGSGGVAEGGDILSGVGVGVGEAVGDGLKPERGEAVEGVGPTGAEESAVVVLRVDEGDVEALRVEELGHL